MDGVLGLKCVLCGAEYGLRETSQAFRYVCDQHGDAGILDVVYDYAAIRHTFTAEALRADPDRSIWRYLPLLPLDRQGVARLRAQNDCHPLWRVGWTPLYRAPRLAASLSLAELYVKDDGRNPSASFKDRASAVGLVKAFEWGASTVAAASTGNAASSLATLASGWDVRVVIFVPASAPQAKIAQLLIHGATVLPVQGTYDQAFDLCLQACRALGWYSRNTGYNPYLSEGKKTAALEICEQLDWHTPDCILVSVGDGCIIGGLGKGLRDLHALGLIDRMPRLIGVQADGSAALYNAWKAGTEEIAPVQARTLADSISVDLPRDGIKALRAVRETGGAFVVVSDDEILAAMRELARVAGVFGEPAGVAGYAGLIKAREMGLVQSGERVVVLVTGSGLKDAPSALKAVQMPSPISPTLEAVSRWLFDGTETGWQAS